MDREIIIVLGKTGQGKSVWTRKFLESKTRLFMFDPLMDVNCEYLDEHGLLHKFDNQEYKDSFRVGIYNSEELPLIGSMAFLTRNCILGIEECAVAFPYGNNSVEQWLREIVFLGRHREVSLILTAQRAQSIPIVVRSQATRIVSYCQQEGTDMRWLQDYFGAEANFISSLPKYYCMDAQNGTISTYTIPGPGLKPIEKQVDNPEENQHENFEEDEEI